jgi:hypothetical protein
MQRRRHWQNHRYQISWAWKWKAFSRRQVNFYRMGPWLSVEHMLKAPVSDVDFGTSYCRWGFLWYLLGPWANPEIVRLERIRFLSVYSIINLSEYYIGPKCCAKRMYENQWASHCKSNVSTPYPLLFDAVRTITGFISLRNDIFCVRESWRGGNYKQNCLSDFMNALLI